MQIQPSVKQAGLSATKIRCDQKVVIFPKRAGKLKAGAADYLLKSQLNADTLERAIRYAIERKAAEEAANAANDPYFLPAYMALAHLMNLIERQGIGAIADMSSTSPPLRRRR